MKKGLVIIALILGFLMAVISVWHVISFEVGKRNGTYVAVDAKVTYVHEYVQKSGKSPRSGFSSHHRANGYFSWEYEGISHNVENERSSKIDLVYGTKEGDTISIWVKRSNGRFEAVNNKYTDRSLILLAVIMPLFWIVVVYSLNKMNYFSKIVKE